MKSFKVNEYITLKLENEKTVIYINNEPFLQCKFLLLEIPKNEFQSLDEINSIDEASEELNIDSAYEYSLPPETEFWGHCSNLQVWVEYDYDTRLIHSSLGFPLLEKLSKIGDIKAKNVLKEEIGKRLRNGSNNVVTFLYEEGYTEYLTREEFFYSLLVPEEAENMLELESILGDELFQRWEVCEPKTFILKNGHVISINLSYCNLKEVPTTLLSLKYLEQLYLYNNEIELIPESITQLRNLIFIDLRSNKLTNTPKMLSRMKHLKIILPENS